MPRAKRRDREIERTREDILAAAARVFARVGYQGATMQEIAREAGYTAPSLYTYFEGKDALMKLLFESYRAELLALFDQPTPRGLSFVQTLELLVFSALELCERRRDVMIAFGNMSSNSMTKVEAFPGNSERESISVQVIGRFARWLSETAKPGDLGVLEPADAAYTLYGLVYVFVQQWDVGGRTHKLTDLTPKAMDLFLYGVRGGKALAAQGKGDRAGQVTPAARTTAPRPRPQRPRRPRAARPPR